MKDWYWLVVVSFTFFLLFTLAISMEPESLPVFDVDPPETIESLF